MRFAEQSWQFRMQDFGWSKPRGSRTRCKCHSLNVLDMFSDQIMSQSSRNYKLPLALASTCHPRVDLASTWHKQPVLVIVIKLIIFTIIKPKQNKLSDLVYRFAFNHPRSRVLTQFLHFGSIFFANYQLGTFFWTNIRDEIWHFSR
jgi:hypothetical protein